MVKNSSANAGDARDVGSVPGLGRSPGRGHGNPLQYSCLENPMDRRAWWATINGITRISHDLAARPSTTNTVFQFSSVTQLCPTLCNPVDCSTPGFPVHHQLPELAQIMSFKSVMPSNHLILCHPLFLLPPIPPSIRVFPMSQLFT